MKQTSMSGILRLSEDGKVVEEVLDKYIKSMKKVCKEKDASKRAEMLAVAIP